MATPTEARGAESEYGRDVVSSTVLQPANLPNMRQNTPQGDLSCRAGPVQFKFAMFQYVNTPSFKPLMDTTTMKIDDRLVSDLCVGSDLGGG